MKGYLITRFSGCYDDHDYVPLTVYRDLEKAEEKALQLDNDLPEDEKIRWDKPYFIVSEVELELE